ncbi:MAG: LuxR C-terminal-related transcriptional regulator [Chroococcidiopsis sp.]
MQPLLKTLGEAEPSPQVSADLPFGWYKHISGNMIRVFDVITFSDSQELMVLYGSQKKPTFCTNLANFCASIVVDGQLRQVYEFVSKYKPKIKLPRQKVRISRRDSALTKLKKNKTASNPYGLSKCELIVAKGIVEGLNARGIAKKLCISYRTVDSHLLAIYHKLGIADNKLVCHIVVASSMLKTYVPKQFS